MPNKRKTIEGRLTKLATFKARHSHCSHPITPSGEYYSLGQWCAGQVRGSYKKIQEGKTPLLPSLQDQIERFEALGFEWSRTRRFQEWSAELAAFKTKHGHCTVILLKFLRANINHWVNDVIK